MSSIVVISPPAGEPVDLQTELKPHLRVTIDTEDKLLAVYLQAARELAEVETGLSLINKGYLQSHDRFPRRHDYTDRGTGYWYAAPRYSRKHGDEHQEIKLLRSPLVSVDKIEYVDAGGNVQLLRPTPELWQPDTEYSVGDQVEDANGNLQKLTAIDPDEENEDGTASSGAAVPTWNASLNGTTTEGPLTWTCTQVPAPAGDFLVDRDSEPPRILPVFGNFWPATRQIPQAVKIYFTAGYGSGKDSVPARAKVLVMQLAGNWNENREAVTPDTLKTIPYHLENLVWSLRVTDYAPTK